MKNILITGAGSYIGTSVEKWLLHWPEKYKVTVLDMISEKWREFDFNGYDVVYHVAGIAHKTNVSDELYERVNHQLAVEVAVMSIKAYVKQFIFMSSGAVYTQSDKKHPEIIVNENTNCEPITAYGISKMWAEEDIKKVVIDHNSLMKITILRPPTVYGPGAKGNYNPLAKMAVSTPIIPKIQNKRSMIYIDNLCEFIHLCIDEEAEGVFLPQNREYVCTSDMMREISVAHRHKLLLVPGLTWAVRLASRMTDVVNKVFGTYIYCPLDGEYFGGRYQVVDFKNSIIKSEGLG